MSERLKRGAISNEEKQFLKDNADTLSPAEIASALGRTEEKVREWFVTVLKRTPDDTGEVTEKDVAQINAERELLRSPEWEALKLEFSEKELKFFRHRYRKLMAQLGNEITATEETQVILLIKYEILMQRNLMDTKSSTADIEKLEEMVKEIHDSYPEVAAMEDSTKNFLMNLENQLLASKSARNAKSTEYVKLTEKHTSLMRELKATRDQRINKIDAAGGTLLEAFKRLQDEKIAAREGRHMELVAHAVNKERKRLSQLHTYSDGSIDQPLLTPESVLAEGN